METKIENLVKSLSDKTHKQEAKWVKVGKAEKFSLILDAGKVTLDKGVTKAGNLYYQFIVLNNSGEGIVTINAIKPTTTISVAGDYHIFKELYELIRKSYFKTDETIDGLIDETKKEGLIGKTPPTAGDLPF